MREQNPLRPAGLALACALMAAMAAAAAPARIPSLKPIARLDLLDPRRTSLPDSETILELGSAMTAYRARLVRAAAAYPSDGPFVPSGARWRWRAESGGTVRRVAEGRFVVTTGDCLERFCVDIACEAAGWPQFACGDGRLRQMSAPDLATVVFDGVTYTRSLPPLSEPVPDPVIPE